MIALKRLAFVLAATLALIYVELAVASSGEFESIQTYDLSRWKFEVHNLPEANKCQAFWERLDRRLTGKELKPLQVDDHRDVRQPDASVLHRLSDWLKSRAVGSASNALINFVDACAAKL